MSSPAAPSLDVTPSRQGWQIELYLEHLDEAAALWEQRPADRENPELSWLDLGDDESRLEAHLDALVLGGDLALAVCRQQALAGDPGERHAALRVFCRHGRGDLVGQALEAIDLEDDAALDAMSDALTAEMPAAWEAGTLRPERLGDPRWLRLAADLVAHRQLPGGAALLGAVSAGHASAAVVRALGRCADGIPEGTLADLLGHPDPGVRLEAGVALLRAGTPGGAMRALPAVRDDPALLPLLGLAGQGSGVDWLRASASQPDAPADVFLALGLLGSPSAVPDLIVGLAGPHPEAAAQALFLMTGADLREATFVEDVPDDDELFDDERERVERGEPLRLPGQEPRGTTLVALSTDAATWQAWWDRHAPALADTPRIRLGQPAGPASQVASLASPALPHALRRWVAEEVVVRYRAPVAFETTWSVARQLAALDALRGWADADRAVPGRWYVGGRYVGPGGMTG